MDQNISVSSDRTGEVRVHWNRQRVVPEVGFVLRSFATEVTSATHRLRHHQVEHGVHAGLCLRTSDDSLHRRGDCRRGSDVDLDSLLQQHLHQLLHPAFVRRRVLSQKGNFGELLVDERRDGDVGEQHELLDQPVAVLERILEEIDGRLHPLIVLVELERDLRLVDLQRAVRLSLLPHDDRELLQLRNNIRDVADGEAIVNLREFSFQLAPVLRLALNHHLSVFVA